MHSDPAVQLLLDRAAIHEVMLRYAAGVDRRDFDLVASCFAPDVVADFGGQRWENRDDLVEFISGVRHFHTTMHMMGNQFIEVQGDTACLESYAMITHHATRSGKPDWLLNMSANRYVEKLERRDGEWVIVQRGGEPAFAPTGVTAMKSDDPAVRWLLDRAEIHDLMMSYALGVDLRDYDRISACFAPHFRARYFDREFTALEPLIAFIRGVEHFASTTHFLGNQLIEIDGDAAAMETYAMITHREHVDADEKPREWMAGGSSYVDGLARVEGRWRVAERGPGSVRVPSAGLRIPTSEDPQVQGLLDRAAIHDRIVAAAFALDRGDEDELEGCFIAAARGEIEGTSYPDRTSFLKALWSAQRPWHSTMHFLGNQLVEVDGDVASAETYTYITRKETAESRATHWSAGARRLVDRLVREDGTWRIAERRILTNRIPEP